nr:reverse transcriptase domain-containing protein [Tanacetum cinerariifolium]
MMIATTSFIRGKATAANKKKGHMSWKPQDQSKKQTNKRPDFRGHSRDGRGANQFTPLTRTPKEILTAEANKFQPPPPMVTPVEKRNETNGPSDYITNWVQWRDYMAADATHSTKAWMNFMIVKSLSPYNGIIGRLGLKAIQAVQSTVHGMLKFPTEEGIVTICSSLLIPAKCASVNTSSVTPGEKKAHPTNLTVPLHPNFLDQEVVVGGSLSDKGRTELCALLKRNLDIFAWQPSDMTGVPRSVAEHRHNVREGYPPVRQKKRGQAPERTKAIQAEVEKLVEAGIMREVYYHNWLSNPVMVKKHDGSWRMCVDFTNLNTACPQDCYPLPEIDWKVESLCGYPFKCFLDAYKGYHQIQMAAADEEKTAFHTGQRVYCYTKMPFSLKNAGATYQRLMDKAFENQMGRNIEVYVDDLVIKSHTETEM